MTIEELKTKIAQASKLPANEASFEVEKGLDATGDKAVWVWITLQHWPDFPTRQQLRNMVSHTVRELEESADFVYVRFRDAQELAA